MGGKCECRAMKNVCEKERKEKKKLPLGVHVQQQQDNHQKQQVLYLCYVNIHNSSTKISVMTWKKSREVFFLLALHHCEESINCEGIYTSKREEGKIDDVIQIKLKYHYEQAEKQRGSVR